MGAIRSVTEHNSDWKLEKTLLRESGKIASICLATAYGQGQGELLPRPLMTHHTDIIEGDITFSVSCFRFII